MQVLVDTSVWVNHLRSEDAELKSLLEDGIVLVHPWIRGELAMGCMKNRGQILGLLAALPESEVATDDEVFHLVDTKKLWGLGVGWVDVHLAAATKLTEACALWTFDKGLSLACEKAGAKLYRRVV